MTMPQPNATGGSPFKWAAILPFIGILVGTPLLNRVMPLVLGLPLIVVWLVFWVLMTSAIMLLIYLTDPNNRTVEPGP
jgi:hypothetical protein